MTERISTPKRVRTCIGCGAQQGKTTLLRIVRTPEGAVFDASGRMPGRGAYVCNEECLALARKRKGLERALKAKIDDTCYERIAAELRTALASESE